MSDHPDHAKLARQYADEAVTHAQKAVLYADRAWKWLWVSIAFQVVAIALMLLSVIARHLGW